MFESIKKRPGTEGDTDYYLGGKPYGVMDGLSPERLSAVARETESLADALLFLNVDSLPLITELLDQATAYRLRRLEIILTNR